MSVAFGLLFTLFCLNKRRLIRLGGEDGKIEADLKNSYAKSKSKDLTFRGHLAVRRKTEKVLSIIINVIFGLVVALIVSVAITGLVYRANGEQLFIGETAYLTIQTGSMSEKNLENPYYNDLPDNQIAQYSLVGINKFAEEDLKLYDIVAFKHNGTLFVHRIVGIYEDNGVKLYTTMGDANNGSFSFEMGMTSDKIVGVYSGYQSENMGAFLSYLNSGTGIIALVFALCLVLVADFTENLLTKAYNERYRHIAGILDGEADSGTPEAKPESDSEVPDE